jgi:hypothetical protein
MQKDRRDQKEAQEVTANGDTQKIDIKAIIACAKNREALGGIVRRGPKSAEKAPVLRRR